MSNPLDGLYGGSYPTELYIDGAELVLRLNGLKIMRLKLRKTAARILARDLSSTSYTLVPEAAMNALKTLKCLRSFCGGCEMNPK